jgi:hypothetical protein
MEDIMKKTLMKWTRLVLGMNKIFTYYIQK